MKCATCPLKKVGREKCMIDRGLTQEISQICIKTGSLEGTTKCMYTILHFSKQMSMGECYGVIFTVGHTTLQYLCDFHVLRSAFLLTLG